MAYHGVMLSWMKKNAHVLIATASAVGVVMVTVAANTTGLLPTSVGAWLAATGSIIVTAIATITGVKIADKARR